MPAKKPARIVLVAEPELTRNELIRAWAADIEGAPVFKAVMQVIAVAEQIAIDAMPGMVNSHGALASEAGGIQVLRELRDELSSLRAQGKRGEDEPVEEAA